MKPNLKVGKTALLICLPRSGSNKRPVVLASRQAQLSCTSRTWISRSKLRPSMSIWLAWYAQRGSSEARRRLAIAKSSYDSGSKLLYGNQTIPLAVRASLFQTSIASTLFNLVLWISGGLCMPMEDTPTSSVGSWPNSSKATCTTKLVCPVTHILTGSLYLSTLGPQG